MTVALAAALAAALSAAATLWAPRVRTRLAARSAWWAGAAGALLGAGAGFVARSPGEAALAAVAAGAFGVLLVVDAGEHRLPDTIVFPGLAAWFAGATALAAATGAWPALGRAALAAVVLFVGFYVAALLARGMLGFGDVKLALLLGAVLGWFGWDAVGVGLVAGVVLHGLVAVGVLVRTRDPKADVPMGPSLIAGAALGVAAATLGVPW